MIDNRDSLARGVSHELAMDCLEAGIEQASPASSANAAVGRAGEQLVIDETTYDLSAYDEILIVGGGKAATGVTRVLEDRLESRVDDGVVITKRPMKTDYVRNVVGDHPIPTERNVEGTTEILGLLDAASSQTLVLAVVTGGASALLCAPAGRVTVEDFGTVTDRLLAAGASIDETNVVRTHLSEIKGGRLSARALPATVVGILISDVVGDDPSTIGSGPTVRGTSTYEDALEVIERYGVEPPTTVSNHLEAGTNGECKEIPDPTHCSHEPGDRHLISSNDVALSAAEKTASRAGFTPTVLSSRLRGEASEVGTVLAAIASEVPSGNGIVSPPAVLLAGGESTVTVENSDGIGGPNQELALSAARDVEYPIVFAAIDTDGEDGSSEHAGALVDHETVTDEREAGARLSSNDAGRYLQARGATIKTGATGTNVNDMVVIVIPSTNGQ